MRILNSIVAQLMRLLGLLFFDGRRSLVRWYATGLMAISVWVGVIAWEYLVRTVFSPMALPPELLPRAGYLDVDVLQAGPDTEGAAPKVNVGHYHLIQSWFQPDPSNNCTTSGCHSPLPHRRKKATRAFANFHANFLSCELCHETSAQPDKQPTWVSTTTRNPVEPPAALRLMLWLGRNGDPDGTRQLDFQNEPLELLREIVALTGGDSALRYLATQLETSEPGSPRWRDSFARLRQELPRYVRGDYGAKIAVHDPAREAQRWQLGVRYSDIVEDDDLRNTLRNQIHEGISSASIECQDCHGGDRARLDFAALGYSQQHAQYLQSTPIAAMMQHIREGRPFHLPSLVGESP